MPHSNPKPAKAAQPGKAVRRHISTHSGSVSQKVSAALVR